MVDKKRDRADLDETVSDSPSLKLSRVAETGPGDAEIDRFDSDNAFCDPVEFERVSPEHVVELFDIFDVPDSVNDHDVAIPELESFVRGLQEEISAVPDSCPVGELADELGYLLEASDDDLGLPPRFSPSTDKQKAIEAVNVEPTVSGAVGFDGQILLNDSFELGVEGDSDVAGGKLGCPSAYDDCIELFDFDDESEDSKLTWLSGVETASF